MSAFTPAGSGGLPPSTVTLIVPTTATVANVPVPLATTEVSYALPAGTSRFMVKAREYLADIKLSYSSGTSGTVYITIPRGCNYSEAEVNTGTAHTLYFQTNVASQVVEIISWA